MRVLLLLVVVSVLSGCSLFGSEPDALAVEPLIDSPSLVRNAGSGPLVVLQSATDELEFYRFYGADPLPRQIDYRRETVVGVVFAAAEPGGRVSIRSLSVDGDQLAFVIDASGSITLPDSSAAAAFPSSFVTVPRLRQDIRGATFEYVGLGD